MSRLPSPLVTGTVAAVLALVVVGCGGNEDDLEPPTAEESQERLGQGDTPVADDPEADEGGATSGTPEDTVLTYLRPASCAEALEIYSSEAWRMMAEPGFDDEMEAAGLELTAVVSGMTKVEAMDECERDPAAFGIGSDAAPGVSADDLEVTQIDGDLVKVKWTDTSGSDDNVQVEVNHVWHLTPEQGEWKITPGPEDS